VRTSTEPTLLQAAAQISIDWNVKPPIVATPSRIVIRDGDAERIIRVESSDGQPLPIVSARCDHPVVSVRKSSTESNAILVNRKPLADAISPLAEIVIDTGSDRNSRVTVAVVLPSAGNVSK